MERCVWQCVHGDFRSNRLPSRAGRQKQTCRCRCLPLLALVSYLYLKGRQPIRWRANGPNKVEARNERAGRRTYIGPTGVLWCGPAASFRSPRIRPTQHTSPVSFDDEKKGTASSFPIRPWLEETRRFRPSDTAMYPDISRRRQVLLPPCT